MSAFFFQISLTSEQYNRETRESPETLAAANVLSFLRLYSQTRLMEYRLKEYPAQWNETSMSQTAVISFCVKFPG